MKLSFVAGNPEDQRKCDVINALMSRPFDPLDAESFVWLLRAFWSFVDAQEARREFWGTGVLRLP